MNRIRAVLVLLVATVLAAGMVVAGLWQLRVYQHQGSVAASRRAAEPPVPLTEVAPAGAPVRDGYGRTVSFRGSYEVAHQMLVPTAGPPGTYRVVTLLRQDDGSAVAVVRGLLVESSTPPAAPDGPLAQSGILLPSEETPSGTGAGAEAGTIRVAELAQQWPGPLVDGFVTLPPTEATAQGLQPAPVALPEGRGRLRNGAYALQWWLFAGFTLVMAFRMAQDVGRRPSDTPVDTNPPA
jgi:surfeit locus 1 family protein